MYIYYAAIQTGIGSTVDSKSEINEIQLTCYEKCR